MSTEEEWLIIDENGNELESHEPNNEHTDTTGSTTEQHKVKNCPIENAPECAVSHMEPPSLNFSTDLISLSPTIHNVLQNLMELQRIGADFCESQRETVQRYMSECTDSAAYHSSQALSTAMGELERFLSSINS